MRLIGLFQLVFNQDSTALPHSGTSGNTLGFLVDNNTAMNTLVCTLISSTVTLLETGQQHRLLRKCVDITADCEWEKRYTVSH